MTTSDKGRVFVKGDEGLKLTAYRKKGDVWTIGWGHTRGVTEGQTITEAQAEALLSADLAIAEKAVNDAVGVTITQNQFDALVDFAFNLGGHALASSTLIRKLNAGDTMGAALEFPKWDHEGAEVLSGLLTRRLAERDLFLS